MSETESKADTEPSIERLREDFASLQAAHASLLERIQDDGDENKQSVAELASLRSRIKELEGELAAVKGERDELNSTVRDLRVRVEESRRAIMRLQGQGGGGPSSGAGASEVASAGALSVNAHNKSDARRSMLASWNPREMPTGLGVITTPASPLQAEESGNHASAQTPEELAELKKSKRASLAFGPHAQGSVMRRMHGHRRIASSSRVGVDDSESQAGSSSAGANALVGNSGGLRELHLGSATVGPSSGTSSKRTSVMSTSLFRSPTLETLELAEDGEQKSGSLLMPQRSIRRSSNSSSISGGQTAEADNGALAPPSRSISRLSQSPSQVSISSPIREGLDGSEEEPLTATAANQGFAKQQGSHALPISTYQLQRSVMEGKAKLRDRDDQITQLKREMTTLRQQLDEATDARKASEDCLQALREFVKTEGGEGADAATLKGVKLPPLPTDKDAEDLEASTEGIPVSQSQSTAPSAWRSIGSSLAGFSRKQPAESDGSGSIASNEKALPVAYDVPSLQGSSAPLSPTAQISSSFGNLWSRATAGTRESASASSMSPSEGTSGGAPDGQSDSRHTSVTSTPGIESNAPATASPSAAFKGFTWFSKRSTSGTGAEAVPTNNGPTATSDAGMRVSSPPFANLDNHVLTLDQVSSPSAPGGRSASYAALNGSSTGSRSTSFASSSAATPASNVGGSSAGVEKEPTGRTKKAMEKSEAVDEDNGFVPPSF